MQTTSTRQSRPNTAGGNRAGSSPIFVCLAICLLAGMILLMGKVASAAQASVGPAAPGSIYYVAPNGSDKYAGTQTRPWATIQHAADLLQPGETVYVRAGTYEQSVLLARSGTQDQKITFAAYPGETVVLDGGDTLVSAFATGSGEPDSHVSDVIIQGFTIRNYQEYGIVARSVNNRLALQELFIEDNGGAGIRLSNSDGTQVKEVLLRNNKEGFVCAPFLTGTPADRGCTHLYLGDVQAIDNGTQGDTGAGAFTVERGAHIMVERCLASGGDGDGFDFMSDHTTLSQVQAHNTRTNFKLWGVNNTLVNALGYDALNGANLVLVAGGSYTVTNVTIANVHETANLVVAGDTSSTGATPVRITNSIFYNDNPANSGTLLYFGPDIAQLTMANNLFYNPHRTDAVICAGFVPYNGDCFSAGEINQGVWPQPETRYADPAFVNAGARNFRLSEESPAVNAGTPTYAPKVDLVDSLRGATPDLGAYETGIDDAVFFYLPIVRQSQ